MRWLALLLVVAALAGCSQKLEDAYRPAPDAQLANEIRKKAAFALQKEEGLIPCGSGGQMMGEIQMLALSFDYRGSITMEEGRRLLVAAVDKLVGEVNADERIRPYLSNYPFEPANVEIRIFLTNEDGSKLEPGSLSVLTATDGTLNYKVTDPQTGYLKTIHAEKYDEALSKIL